jgi:hypothetical protein
MTVGSYSSHAVRCVRLEAERASPGLGGTPNSVSECPKGYPETLLAYERCGYTESSKIIML